MKSEMRLIIYTNDAILLAISEFPLSVVKWETLSQSQKSAYIVDDDEEYRLITKITNVLSSQLTKSTRVLPIDEKLFSMPPGFTPKISKLACIDDEGRVLEFKRITLHPKFVIDPSHLEVIERIGNVWNMGYAYIDSMINENPQAEGFLPKYKRTSILQLEKVNGEEDEATNSDILWDVWDQIIQGGNRYAKTPICNVVERTQVNLRHWEYRPFTQRPTSDFPD